MESLSSVSKGCFYVPALKKSRKCDLKAENYLKNEDPTTKAQSKMADEVWKNMNQRIKHLHNDLTAKIFNDLFQFMKKSSEKKFQENSGKRTEIPAAALITGVNMPDHTEMFEELVNKVKTRITPHIALLSAKHCSNMKSLMRCIGQQLVLDETADSHNASVDDNDLDRHSEKSTIWRKSIPFTMSILEKWHSQVELPNKASNKRKNQNHSTSAIVLMLRDVEAFPSQLLHDFITMLSSWVHRLPIILVFGVSTSWSSVVDRQLPHSATVHLSLEKFHFPSASQHLALIIDELLLTSEQHFKLGGKCLQSLLDTFLCHDFSITNFLRTLKFCVLEHFYNQPASILCMVNEIKMMERVEKPTPGLLKHLQSLPSVQSFLSTLTTRQNEDLSRNEKELKTVLKSMLQTINDFHVCFFPVMRCLFCLCKSLPRHPLGRQIRELYCLCSKLKITETEGYKEAKLFLQVSSRDMLIQKLRSCHAELEKIPMEVVVKNSSSNMFCIVGKAKNEISSVINNLEHLEDVQDEEEGAEDNVEKAEDKPLEKVKYAYQLQEKLKTRSKQKKFQKMSKFEKLRLSALDTLHELFRKVLLPPRTIPLHEVFYFDSVSSVRRHMNVAPRLAIQTALGDPYHYLKHPCLNSNVIPPNAPDVCIAYKLHNECGRLINLYDWMEAFHTIVTSAKDDEEPIGEIDETTQARFIRAASELQFLGLVKPTKRKTDHVQRLTWSHS